MPTDIVMPQMGESIFEGTITKWLKQPGDKVQRDEPLFEISTDKVDAEIPAPASGTLQEIKVAAGNTVQVNTVVGVIAGEGDGAAAPAKAAAPAAPAPEAKKKPPAASSAGSSRACREGARLRNGERRPGLVSAPARWCAKLPKTTMSIWRESLAQASAAASPRTTSKPSSPSTPAEHLQHQPRPRQLPLLPPPKPHSLPQSPRHCSP